MWSRRKFIALTLASLGLWAECRNNAIFAFGPRLKGSGSGPALLAGEYWSPAIACDFIGVFDGDLCCILDEFGRLVTASILPSTLQSHIFPILGRVDNLGDKVLDFHVMSRSAAALVWNQANTSANDRSVYQTSALYHRQGRYLKPTAQEGSPAGQFAITLVNLTTAQSPHIISITNLPDYSEIHTFALNKSFVCIAGIDESGNNQASLYKLGIGRRAQLQLLSKFALPAPVKNILFAGGQLFIVHDNPRNTISVVALNDIKHPEVINTVVLPNGSNLIACEDNIFVTACMMEARCHINLGFIKDFPQPVSKISIDTLQSVDALVIKNKNIMVLGREQSVVAPLFIDREYKLHERSTIDFSKPLNDNLQSKLVLGKNNAFISSGWDGIQVLSLNASNNWTPTAHYSVPKLPVAGLVIWSNYLVLASTDLRLYDLSRVDQPKLVNTTKLATALKKIVLAGSYILCLDRNSLTLRKIEDFQAVLAKLSVSVKELSFDALTKKAYLIQDIAAEEKGTNQETRMTEVNVYNNNMEVGKSFVITGDAYCSSASGGYVVVGGLNNISLYKPDQTGELICQRQFENLAWREIVMINENIFATAVDHNANGIFLTMAFKNKEINLLSSIKIPHDGVALVVENHHAFCIGQAVDGHNLLTMIDVNDLAVPKIIAEKPVLESASCLTIADKLAVVSGRGFEIFRV